MAGAELVEQLRSALDRAGELARVLETNLRESQRGPGGELPADLQERLVTAETDVVVFVIAQRQFLAVVDDVPTIAHKLMASLAGRVRELDRQYYG